MIEIRAVDYKDDLKRLERDLRRFPHEMPFAMAFTLTRMGQAGKQAATKSIPKVFDEPTRWTRGAVYLRPATKTRLKSEVYVKDGSVKSLEHHITGGKRRLKRFERRLRMAGIMRPGEYAVPGIGMRLNRFGNVTVGQLNKVLSAMGAQGDKYQNTTARSLKRNPDQGRIFAMDQAGSIRRGIYRSKGKGDNRTFTPMLVFMKGVRYRAKWDFFGIVDDAAYDAMGKAIDEVLRRILKPK